MQAGSLKHRVEVQSETITQNSTGEPIRTWSTFAWCNAKILPATGRQYEKEDLTKVQNTYKIEIRYLAGLSPLMRLKVGRRTFNIKHVLNFNEANVKMILSCTETTT